MFNLGGGEILVILLVALLVLGPEKLPRFMRTAGKALGDLRRASTDFQRSINLELTENEPETPKTQPEQTDLPASQKNEEELPGERPEEQPGEQPEKAAVEIESAPPSPSRSTHRLRATPPRGSSRPKARR